ncbi:MAG: divalent-cation tolerance protein CutA [Steroidobacteraceae bacterium]
MDSVVICLTTCPNNEIAAQLATALVEEQLAACVNELPGVRSTYRWQGKVHSDQEVLLVIKTTTARLPTLETRLKALHPYDLPELVAIPVCAGSTAYLDWVRQNTAINRSS